mgnify:CR=1 FL=1
MLSGASEEFAASVVVNAGGPWVDAVLDTTGLASRRYIGGTKGSHIIVGKFDGAPKDAFYVEAEKDQRPFFIIPWNGLYLIGTTDIRYDGDLSAPRASREEVDYLLAETNRVFPRAQLRVADVHYAYAGIRPLPYKEKGPESAITRKHIIRVNREIGKGLVSIIGGKLTTYRNLAEQTVDRLGKLLKRKLPECRTQTTLLPGAYRLDEARRALQARAELSPEGVERLLGLYGGRALDLLELADAEPPLAKALDEARTVLAAEVVFAVRSEMARTLEDIVFRRLTVGFDADQGRLMYDEIAALAADEAGWSPEQTTQQLEILNGYAQSLRVG